MYSARTGLPKFFRFLSHSAVWEILSVQFLTCLILLPLMSSSGLQMAVVSVYACYVPLLVESNIIKGGWKSACYTRSRSSGPPPVPYIFRVYSTLRNAPWASCAYIHVHRPGHMSASCTRRVQLHS